MSTLNKMQTPPTQAEKQNPVTFFGNPIILNNLASHLKGVDFAEFLVDQKNMELEKQGQQGKANNGVQGYVNNNAVNVNT